MVNLDYIVALHTSLSPRVGITFQFITLRCISLLFYWRIHEINGFVVAANKKNKNYVKRLTTFLWCNEFEYLLYQIYRSEPLLQIDTLMVASCNKRSIPKEAKFQINKIWHTLRRLTKAVNIFSDSISITWNTDSA